MLTAYELSKEVGLTVNYITIIAKNMPAKFAWKEGRFWYFSVDVINWIKKRCKKTGPKDKKVPKRYFDCISYEYCLNGAAFAGSDGKLDCNKCEKYQRNTEVNFIY